MASLAFLFTVINAFNSDAQIEVILQLASGTIWIWMIPVILGWILVGTQSRAGAINSALHDYNRSTYRAPFNTIDPVKDNQEGIISRAGMSDGHSRAPHWLGISVIGDEAQEGPIYNYCRIFTWFQCAIFIERGFSGMLENLRGSVRDRKRPEVPGVDHNRMKPDPHGRLLGTSKQVADFCNLPLDLTMNAYSPWSEIQAKVWSHIILSSIAALFVQWGTTGPAILISYFTPTKGLGCRSGSYVLYGCIATTVWFLLTCSCFLSHAVMLRDQKRKAKEGVEGDHISTLAALAVGTRYVGKALAVINAGWLVLCNFLEYIGTFNQCWCGANVLSMGQRGWVAIFAVATAETGSGYLAGGLAFSVLVCAASLGFFWLASADHED